MLKPDPRSPTKLKPMAVKTATTTPATRLVDKITRPVARLADNIGDFILNAMSGGRR